jgi:hypothetical protein
MEAMRTALPSLIFKVRFWVSATGKAAGRLDVAMRSDNLIG